MEKDYKTIEGSKIHEEYNEDDILIFKSITYPTSKKEYRYNDRGEEIEFTSYFKNGDVKYHKKLENNTLTEEFTITNLKVQTIFSDNEKKIIRTFKKDNNILLNIKEYEDNNNYTIDYLDGRVRKITQDENSYISELYKDGILEETYTKEIHGDDYNINTIFHKRNHEINIIKEGNSILITSPKRRVEILDINKKVVTKLVTIIKENEKFMVIYKYKKYLPKMKLIQKIYNDPITHKKVIENFQYVGNKRIMVSSINY